MGVAAIIVVSYWLGQQAYTWMPIAATAEAKHVDNLFSFLVGLGAFVFFSVVGTIVYSIITYRADPNDYIEGHPSRGNNRIEFLWTATPTILVSWIAWKNLTIYQELGLKGSNTIIGSNASASTRATLVAQTNIKPIEQIEVHAKQWEWTFHYPQSNITTGELHLPQNKSVRLVLESADVIHGFYVPEFRFKQDIIPGHILGLYTLHGTMMIFLWIIPSQVGLANYLIPLMIGTKNMAFPKLNAIAFWIIPVAGILLISSFLLPSGSAQAGLSGIFTILSSIRSPWRSLPLFTFGFPK
jgi:heme/copper-type cytochrome/quinol oxidase subunit 2